MRRRTSPPRSALAVYKQSAPISPTGPSRIERKADKAAHRAAVIAETRRQVFARDRQCRVCEAPGHPRDEMHEIVPRSLVRGRAPEEVFSAVQCVRVCPPCHHALTAHRVWLEPLDPVEGANGGVAIMTRHEKQEGVE